MTLINKAAGLLAAALLLAPSGARSAAGVVVPDVYDVHDIDAPDAVDGIGRCVGVSGSVVRDFVADDPSRASAELYGELRRPAGTVLAVNGKWACVRMSPEGFPVWPAEAMRGLVVITGLAPRAMTAWRRRLLDAVARDGVGRGLVVYPQGTAYEIDVFADRGSAAYISYEATFLQKGHYDVKRFSAVLADPHAAGVTISRVSNGRSRPNSFAIPDDRLRVPLDGEYAHRAGDPATSAFAFEGTHWTLRGSQVPLDLLPDGIVQGDKGGGTWRVDDGVLHVALDSGSRLSLSVAADGRSLRGESRRSMETPAPETDNEFRGKPIYDRR